MLHLLTTYDYELFFTTQKCNEDEVILKPTKEILRMHRECNAKATFFADVCCLQRYKQLRMFQFEEAARRQLQDAVRQGNDVQLHLHPHWAQASYVPNDWVYDMKDYRLHNFDVPNREPNAEKIIRDGVFYLTQAMQEADAGYKCIAFRAGGYCLQPERHLLQLLWKNGIRVDSSVVPGGVCHRAPHEYDYRKLPVKAGFWIDPKVGFSRRDAGSGKGNIFEVPIASAKPGVEKLYMKCTGKTMQLPLLRGSYLIGKETLSPLQKIIEKIEKFSNMAYVLTLDDWDCNSMLKMLEINLRRLDVEKEELYFAVIGHPKVSCPVTVEATANFIEAVRERYGKNVVFESMREVANCMAKESTNA